MTFTQWQAFARDVDAKAERVRRLIVADARRTARAAGLDPECPFHMAHNATIEPVWAEVDQSLARKVLWLERRSWEPGRIAERVIARAFAKVAR